MKRKMVFVLVVVIALAALGLTAVVGAQDDAPGSASTCPDFGRLDYNYACQNGDWRPPDEAAKVDESFDVAGAARSCSDFGRLDYNYACQNGGWSPPAVEATPNE
jgi:hypothetical protein